MPNLPTFNVTAAQQQRIATAVGDVGDGVAYKAWLKGEIIAMVQKAEAYKIQNQAQAQCDTNNTDVTNSLNIT